MKKLAVVGTHDKSTNDNNQGNLRRPTCQTLPGLCMSLRMSMYLSVGYRHGIDGVRVFQEEAALVIFCITVTKFMMETSYSRKNLSWFTVLESFSPS